MNLEEIFFKVILILVGGMLVYLASFFKADKNEMRKLGFQQAFVVAFVKGERISLEKAIKLAKK